MIKIDVRGDFGKSLLDGIRRDLHPKVIQPAINKVAEKAKAEINRAIPQEYAVKASEVRSAVSLYRARTGRLEARIDIFGSASKKGRSMNMIHFLQTVVQAGQQIKLRGAKGKRADLAKLEQQLGFLIKKGGGLKKIEGAFVGNKGRTIFRRVPGKQMDSRSGNLTKHSQYIEPLQVIGFSQMFKSRKIERRVMDKIASELPIEIDRALARLMA